MERDGNFLLSPASAPGEVHNSIFDWPVSVRLFSELRTLSRNPYLKAVDYVIHVKLRDSRGPCRNYVGILMRGAETWGFLRDGVPSLLTRDCLRWASRSLPAAQPEVRECNVSCSSFRLA